MKSIKVKRKAEPKFEVIKEDDARGKHAWQLLRETVNAYHEELTDLKFAMVWRLGSKPSKDGLLELGRCHAHNERLRVLFDVDVVISLNAEKFPKEDLARQRAIMDHELTHVALVRGKDGEPVVDGKGRRRIRVRKHDVTEFAEVVERHGVACLLGERVIESIRQLRLPFDKDKKAKGKSEAAG